MSLLVLNSLQKSFGGQTILNPTSLEINAGQHIGLVGRNGCGKTTLLRIIGSLESSSGGHLVRTPGITIGYLEQDPLYKPGRSLYEEVREGISSIDIIESQLRELEEKLADPALKEDEKLYQAILNRYSNLNDKFESREGWLADVKVESVLDGLKVPRSDWERDASTFSGGERNIIGLARVLVQDPDLMLLDEPGNHLDFEGLDWLEQILNSSKGAFLLVSHNRYLLDSVCKSIFEMEKAKIEVYKGNYSAYRAEKLTRMQKLEAAAKRQEKEIYRLQFQIQRLKSWANVYDNPKLARTAKNFERRINRMQPVEKIREDNRKLGVSFSKSETKGDIALSVKQYSKSFTDDEPLINNASFLVSQGERVALVGANGTGKTTLIKDIVKKGRWEDKTLRVGPSMKIGYFAQMGENLEYGNQLIDEAMRLTGLLRNRAEAMLYRFLFQRDDFSKPVSVLSGGEKARLQLAALMTSEANFLILDEPTNHLDIKSREAVEDALEEFKGTLFVVSHDRYFLDKMIDNVLYLTPPKIEAFEGNFSEFWYKLKDERELASSRNSIVIKNNNKDRKEKDKQKFYKIKFNAERFSYLEQEIARLEKLKDRLKDEISIEIEKNNRKREQSKRKKLVDTETRLEEIYEEWFAMGDRKKEYK